MTEFVYGAVDGLGDSLHRFAVMTMEVPWSLVKDRIGGSPASTTFVNGLDQAYLDRLLEELPPIDTIVGVGGGVSIDAAKYVAWRRGCSLVLVPTIISVDAYVTQEIAVRNNGIVNYMGKVFPKRTVIDYKAIQSAPKYLNTAGAGDIYSGRTALFDWKLAHEKAGEPYDEEVAAGMARVLDTLKSNAGEIKNVTQKGIRTLVELHSETNRLINLAPRIPGKPPTRPEEGSEHAFFYTLENITGRSFVHGQSVGTGIFVLTRFQTGEEDDAGAVMDSMGLLFRPKEYGVSHDEFVSTLLEMKTYSRKAGLLFSILDVVEITREDAEELWNKL